MMTPEPDYLDDEPLEADATLRVSKRPRIWPVFVAFVLAIVGSLVVSVILVSALVVWHLVQGGNLAQLGQDLMELLTDPPIFLGLLLSTQVVIFLAALVPAILSPEPTWSRLGFTVPAVPIWGYPILILGAGVPAAIAVALAELMALLVKPDPIFDLFYDKVTWSFAVPWVLFIGLSPGFCEEMFFRGYMQRRLLARWSPWVAILVTSALFGIIHMNLHQGPAAFVLGIWLGVVAWRTGSIWLCIATHALFNSLSSVQEIGMRLAGWPEYPPLIPNVIAGMIVLVCFAVSIWLLARCQPKSTIPVADDADRALPTSAQENRFRAEDDRFRDKDAEREF
jgi:uncharacterized protein